MANGLFGGGDGTVYNPYLVEDARDLNAVRNNLSAHYVQVADIDLSMYENFVPIGGYDKNDVFDLDNGFFRGTYNGLCYKISNLKCSRNKGDFAGLFAAVLGGTIKNVEITNADILNMPNEKNVYNSTGILLGELVTGTISNCNVTGMLTGFRNIGGLIGTASNYANSNIKECSANIDIKGVYYNNLPPAIIGGLVGHCGINITNCFAVGNIIANDTVGGLIGVLKTLIRVINCYAACSITKVDNNFKNFGGLVGVKESVTSITSSYYDRSISGQSDTTKGTPKSTFEMQQQSTYLNWDSDIWSFKNSIGYPDLGRCFRLEVSSKDSLGQPVDLNYWNTSILLDGQSYNDFINILNNSSRVFLLKKKGTKVEITARKNGFLIPKQIITISQDTDLIVTAKPYDFANQKTYYISTPQEFLQMSDPFGKYVLKNDIDFTDIVFIPPFKHSNYNEENGFFMGDFDGAGFTLSNINLSTSNQGYSDGLGLFGVVYNARLVNVKLVNCNISDDGSSNSGIGFLVGAAQQIIVDDRQPSKTRLMHFKNCSFENCTMDFTNSAWNGTGGVVGELEIKRDVLNVINIPSDYKMFSEIFTKGAKINVLGGGGYIGGFIGSLDIQGSNVNSTIKLLEDIEVDTIVNFGGNYVDSVGGLIGYCTINADIDLFKIGSNLTINNSNDMYSVGGLFGYFGCYKPNLNIENWYADVKFNECIASYNVGGICGYFEHNNDGGQTTFKNGYLVSKNDMRIDDYNDINVLFGGEYVDKPIIFTNFYIDKEVNGMIVDGSYSEYLKTTAEMVRKATFTSFDFDKIWTIAEGSSYPVFKISRVFITCKRVPLTNYRR